MHNNSEGKTDVKIRTYKDSKKFSSMLSGLFTVLGIIFAFLGLLFLWYGLHVNNEDSIVEKYTGIINLFSILLIVVDIGILILSGEIIKLSGIAKIVLVLLAGLIIYHLYLAAFRSRQFDIYRESRFINTQGLFQINRVGNDILNYAMHNDGYLPHDNNWSDCIQDRFSISSEFSTIDAGIHDKSNDFAFNKNISEMNINNIPDNVILLFEAEGPLNLSGGEELLSMNIEKDKYFRDKNAPRANRNLFSVDFGAFMKNCVQLFTQVSKLDNYRYIFFVDGKVGKYYFYNQQVEIADSKTGVITYRQLRWEP